MLWNDRRTPEGHVTDTATGRTGPLTTHSTYAGGGLTPLGGIPSWHAGGGGSAPSGATAARGWNSAHEGMKRAAAAGASTYGKPKQSGLRKLAGKLGR